MKNNAYVPNKEFLPGKSWINVSGAEIDDFDKSVLHEVVEGKWYTEGKWCKKFESELRWRTTKRNIQLVNSGSSASLVAMTSAIKKFDPDHKRPYVLTCATAFPTTVSPIYQNGRIPLYVDIDPNSLEPIYPEFSDALLKPHKDEICGAIFTHTMGFPFDEEWVKTLLTDSRFLIADCCDALGSYGHRTFYNDYYPVGKYADLSTYSFFPAHHITTGEGGAVATDDPILAELARCYSNWGRSCWCQPGQSNTCGKRFEWEDRGGLPEGWDHKYVFSEIGYNLKMTDFQGALGYSQSLKLDQFGLLRRKNYEYLFEGLADYYNYFHLITLEKNVIPFGFPILRETQAPFTTSELVEYLESKKIRTRRLFGGNITKQPAFMDLPKATGSALFGSDRVMNDMIWIGCYQGLTREMLEYVLEAFDEFIRKYE